MLQRARLRDVALNPLSSQLQEVLERGHRPVISQKKGNFIVNNTAEGLELANSVKQRSLCVNLSSKEMRAHGLVKAMHFSHCGRNNMEHRLIKNYLPN